MPSGHGDDQFEAGLNAFENGVAGEGRGNEDRAGCGAGLFHGVGHGVIKIGTFLPPCSKNWPPLPGVTPATTLEP